MDFIYEFIDYINYYFSSPGWQQLVYVLKIISVIISVLLFVGIVVLISKFNVLARIVKLGDILVVPERPKKKIVKKWDNIEKKLESRRETDRKLAIIEADNLFDDLLKKIGYRGKDMGERLKQIDVSKIANIDEIWQAHKVRNNIVHSPDYKLKRSEAEKAIGAYGKAFEELEVL